MALAARLHLRMQKELRLLLTDPPPGVSLAPSHAEPSPSLSEIEARIAGPEGTAYAGGTFAVRIQVPERYPFHPPNVTFRTPIYHPNIDGGGRICLDILHLPPKGAWQPSLNISTVLTSIGLLLSEPNPDDGLMCEASREYKYNRQLFDQKARSWTEKYAKPDICGTKLDTSNTFLTENASATVLTEDTTQPEPSVKFVNDPISENDVRRKKIRVVGDKLSLRALAVAERDKSCNKENILQPENKPLSISPVETKSPLKQKRSEDKSNFEEHVMQNLAIQAMSKKCEKIAPSSDTIVLDSEESEDENERPGRTRLSLLRKRMAGGGRPLCLR